jgi:hypothetical protein
MVQAWNDLPFKGYTSGVIKEIILQMRDYPMGRQAATFKKEFDQQKAKPHLVWLNEAFVLISFI